MASDLLHLAFGVSVGALLLLIEHMTAFYGDRRRAAFEAEKDRTP